MSIGRAFGGYFLIAGNGESGFGNREPAASSRQPEVCTTPLPTLVQGWVASAYILSCAPLLVRGERATQWRGGIAEGTPKSDSRKPAASSRKSALRPCPPLSRGGWRAPIYSLAPHCLSGGEGHAVVRGDCRRHADSR